MTTATAPALCETCSAAVVSIRLICGADVLHLCRQCAARRWKIRRD